MAFVITSACIGVKDESCVATCPVDCIIGMKDDPMLFIDPSLCIDCDACAPVCPVKAIVKESELPEELREFAAINRDYFSDRAAVLSRLSAIPVKDAER